MSTALRVLSNSHKHVWGVEVWLHAFLTSALDADEWLASHYGRFTPGERGIR